MIVYLWDAGHWCGVCGELPDAQKAAAEHMGDAVWIDEAHPAYDNAQDLVRTYQRTGRTWTAQRSGDGPVTWIMSSTEPGGTAMTLAGAGRLIAATPAAPGSRTPEAP